MNIQNSTCGNIVLRAAERMGGAENLGDSGEVGWEELVSDAPPPKLPLGDSVQKLLIAAIAKYRLYCSTLQSIEQYI